MDVWNHGHFLNSVHIDDISPYDYTAIKMLGESPENHHWAVSKRKILKPVTSNCHHQNWVSSRDLVLKLDTTLLICQCSNESKVRPE